MAKPTQLERNTPTENNQRFKSTLDREAIDRLKDLALDNRVLDTQEDDENMTIEELEDLEQTLSARDPNFRSELDYDGYKDIRAYDNDEYNGNMDETADNLEELNFSDRVEDPSIAPEESVIDKQENRKET